MAEYILYEELSAKSRHQGQGQVTTSHVICGMQLLVPVIDTLYHSNDESKT